MRRNTRATSRTTWRTTARSAWPSTELARTTLTQTRRQDATSANLTSLSAQAVNVTSPIVLGPGSVVDSLQSVEESANEARTVTSKATSRTIQDHKVSFTLSTVRGSEDWTSACSATHTPTRR